ncbi:MAG: glycosyltransferase family 2 protein [Chloroflexi bacterium]|nr:glycosyltransferase family 2 protein [Chloroflexota bacterium]
MPRQPDISVLVVNWNTADLLPQCLSSVVHQAHEVDLELVVVDNASTDGSADLVQRQFPQAHLVANRHNRGFAAANNQAMAQAHGRIFFLLNSDAYLRPGALRALRDFMDEHPEAAVVGAKVLNPDGSLQPSCFRFPTAWDVFCEMFFLTALFPQSPVFNRRGLGGFDRRTTRPVDWVLGAAMAVRAEWAAGSGGLDEGYFIYVEEMDWCRRIGQAGGPVVFFPGAEVVHHGGVSRGRARAVILPRAFASRFRYYQRFHGPGYARLVRGLTLAGMIPRWAVSALAAAWGGAPPQREAQQAYAAVCQVAWRGRYEEELK